MDNAGSGRNYPSLMGSISKGAFMPYAMQMLFLFSILLALISGAQAQTSCSVSTGCRPESDWNPGAFLSTDEVPGMSMQDVRPGMTAGTSFSVLTADEVGSRSNESTDAIEKAQVERPKPEYRSGQFANGRMLRPILSLSSSDVVLDASDGSGYDKAHIKGAICLPAKSFLNDSGGLRGASEMASILGQAGISRDDPVVVYGDSLASGEATFVLWVLKYLGHEDARLLDGGLDDYIAAGLPVQSGQESRPAADYLPKREPELLASYSLIKDRKAVVIDAGMLEDSKADKIPGSIFLDASSIVDGDKLAGSDSLNSTFARLGRDKPVIACSEDGMRASLVWYALQLMGYDSRLYTLKDWQAHQLPVSPVNMGSKQTIFKKLGRVA